MLEVFEPALRKLDRAGSREWGDNWYPRLARRRETLKTAYAALDEPDRDPIMYGALTAQAAYVFAYAPPRAEYARQFLIRHRQKLRKPLFSTKNLRVVSFGGGPASELVGLVRYLEDATNGEIVERIAYTVYDKDGEWEEVASNVIDALDTEIEVSIRYGEVDVASRRSMREIDLANTELVIFSYIMSELCKLSQCDRIAENFRSCLAGLPVGSKILFIDSLYPPFIDYFRSCKLVRGLEEKSDSGERIEFDLPNLEGTFRTLAQQLDWLPRTDLRSVSKLIVRTRS
jgi:hypothetical protein